VISLNTGATGYTKPRLREQNVQVCEIKTAQEIIQA
jgi:hypothetical protein